MEKVARTLVEQLHSGGSDAAESQATARSDSMVELEIRLDFIAADILFDAGREFEAYKRAHDADDLAQKLVERNPANAEWQVLRLNSMQRVGDTLALQRRYPEARDQFLETLKRAKSQSSSPPACDSDLRSATAYFESRVGDMSARLGDFAQARERYLGALNDAETCVQTAPRWRAAVPRYLAKVADTLAEQAEPDLTGSLSKFGKALELQETLANSPDANSAVLSNLALSHFGNAKALAKDEQWKPAIVEFKRAIFLHKQLVDEDKANANWLSYLASELRALGEAYLHPSNMELAAAGSPAIIALQEEVVVRGKLVGLNQKSTNLAADLADAKERLNSLTKPNEPRR
jgi:tetratricopeptide (TPR) repeat protein